MRIVKRSLILTLASLLLPAAGLVPAAMAQVEGDPELYNTYCGVCHRADGQGVEGAFPPLAGSRYLLENPERTIDIIIHGLTEPIRVDEFYEGAMPPLGYLEDEQIAAIVNYTLNAWGNDGGTVTLEQVEERREEGEPVGFEDREPEP